jgi:hypothetical protein
LGRELKIARMFPLSYQKKMVVQFTEQLDEIICIELLLVFGKLLDCQTHVSFLSLNILMKG